jgi:hypothetical protein
MRKRSRASPLCDAGRFVARSRAQQRKDSPSAAIWNKLEPGLYGERAMIRWRRFNETKSRKERLLEELQQLRAQASLLPPGAVRDALLRRARQTEIGIHLEGWVNSPGLQPPTQQDRHAPMSSGYAGQARRFRDKAAEAEQLIESAQTPQRRETLRQIADTYHRAADHLAGAATPPHKPER